MIVMHESFSRIYWKRKKKIEFWSIGTKICVDRNHQSIRKSDVGIRSARANIHTQTNTHLHTLTHRSISHSKYIFLLHSNNATTTTTKLYMREFRISGLSIYLFAKVIQDRTDYSLLPVIAEQVRCLLLCATPQPPPPHPWNCVDYFNNNNISYSYRVCLCSVV